MHPNSSIRPSIVKDQSEEHRRPDIIFAYANCFGSENEERQFEPMAQNSIIDADNMF